MKTNANISVIIPSNHPHSYLLEVVIALCCQTVKPTEIIVVDSFVVSEFCPANIQDICRIHGVNLIYSNHKVAFPGQARNIGLDLAKEELVAFIDVQTIPRSDWLQTTLVFLSESNFYGVYGSTNFSAQTWFEKLIRDAFFGVLPRKTLPGSIFKREIFHKVGHFIDWVRAGEDTEWMLRLDLMKLPVASLPTAFVDYDGLIGMNLKFLLSKWYRNYSASHELPHLFPQKLFLWLILYPLIIFIGFNWNYLIANWHEDSPLYIAHITKIAASLPFFVYILTRGVFLPLRRGVSSPHLFPLRFMAIAAICFIADAVKALVLTIPKRRDDTYLT